MTRLLRLLAILLMLGSVSSTRAQDGKPDIPTPDVEDVVRLFDAMKRYKADLPRIAFDPAAVIEQVGSAPDALLAWVDRSTGFVPYRGTLRGPDGVLSDRRGNSLDRALLLARLLELAGHEVRLARATLDAAVVARILSATSDRDLPSAPTLSPEQSTESAIRALGDAGFSRDGAAVWMEIRQNESLEALDRLHSRSVALSARLDALVSPHALPVQIEVDDILADHWWVEFRSAAGWTGLDPTLPGSAPGETLAKPDETKAVAALDARLGHRVVLRVVAERARNGSLERITLVENEVPRDALIKSYRVGIMPMGLTAAGTRGGIEQVDNLRNEAIAETEWLPILEIGGKTFMQRFVNVDGDVLDTNDTEAEATRLGQSMGGAIEEAMGGGMMNLFESLPSGGEETEESALPKLHGDRALTAMWLEIETLTPNGEARIERRVFYDYFSGRSQSDRDADAVNFEEASHRARALGLLARHDGLVTFGRPNDIFLAHEALDHWMSQREKWRKAAEAAGTGEFQALAAALDEIEPWPAALHTVTALRASDRPLSAPFVVERVRSVGVGPDDETILSDGIDIVTGDVSASGFGNFSDHLASGVYVTLLEGALLDQPTARNAALAMEAEPQADWVVLATGGQVPDLPEPLRHQVLRALDEGKLVVLPVVIDEVATFWRIDPATGDTLGLDFEGHGSAIWEYVILKTEITRERLVFYRALGCLVAAKAGLALAVYGALHPGATTGTALDATRDTGYRAGRAGVKQIACLIAAGGFGMPGETIYRVGAVLGAVNFTESVADFTLGRYIAATGR